MDSSREPSGGDSVPGEETGGPPAQQEPGEVEEPVSTAPDEESLDRLWEEAYEELVVPEEPPKPRRRRSKHRGGLISIAIVLVILMLWTLLSPHVMSAVGNTYVRSEHYASWGNYTGTIDLWTGSTTWGVSIRSISASEGNSSVNLGVLITKVSETTTNWFVRGTGITVRNVSAFDESGRLLGEMTNYTDLGYGILAYLPISFDEDGVYLICVKVKFLVSGVMRIGFLPLKSVQVEKVWVDFRINVVVP